MLLLLEYTDVVDLHFGRAAAKGCNLVDVMDAREISADCEIEEDEVVLAELVVTEVLYIHLEVWLGVRIGVKVDIHRHLVLIPDTCECMELTVLHRIAVGIAWTIVRMIRLTPVACTVEELLLSAVVDTTGISHLEDIDLTAVWPTLRLEVVTHHPECRPQTVRCLRKFDGRHYISILEIYLAEGDQTSRRSSRTLIVLLARSDHKLAITNIHILRTIGIILKF